MDNKINHLVSKVNIVDVIGHFSQLYKAGSSYKTLCNVHGDTTPSLSINTRKQIYKCFVCDHGGNAIDYLIWSQNFSFQKAIEFIVNLANENVEDYIQNTNKQKYSDKELTLFKAFEDANNLFKYFLSIYEKETNNFIEKRHLNQEEIKKYSIGFVPKNVDYKKQLVKKGNEISTLINASLLTENEKLFFENRIIFPIFNEDNKIIAFSGRKISDADLGPKYLHSKESLVFKKSNVIYNYNNAKKFDSLIIVEGFMDVIAFNKIGCDNVIAIMGTSLTDYHVNKLKYHKELTLFLDNDSAGINATIKTVITLLKNNINLYVINNETSKDPDEIVNSENGKEKLKKIITNKENAINFLISNYWKNTNPNDSFSIKSFIENFKDISIYLDKITYQILINKIKDLTKISFEELAKLIPSKKYVVEFIEKEKVNQNNKKNPNYDESTLLLIALLKNPTFEEILTKEKFVWPNIQQKRVHDCIKKEEKEEINKLLSIEKQINKIKIPTNEKQIKELIDRINQKKKKHNIDYLNKIIKDSNDKETIMAVITKKQNKG